MNIAEFGQSIKQKYPQYQDISDEELGQKMLDKYPQYGDMVDKTPPTHPAISALRALGGGSITDLTGIAQQPGRMATGQTDNPFFTQEQKTGMETNPAGTIASSAGNDILRALGNLVTVGGAAKIAPYLTYGGLANMANKAAEEGKNISFSDVIGKAKEGVNSTRLLRAIERYATQYAPASLEGGSLSSPEALSIRREILKRMGPSIFEGLTTKPDEKFAATQVRNALSSLLHEASPGTVTPDKLYGMYKAGGPLLSGDIPAKMLKLGVGIPAIRAILGPTLGRIISSATHE